MSASVLVANSKYHWRQQLTNMLLISRQSTNYEIDTAYSKEKEQLASVSPKCDNEKKLLDQKLAALDQAYYGYKSQEGQDANTNYLQKAYEEAAATRIMQLSTVPFVLWLISRIVNIPLNCVQDCTRCSCCNDESFICFCHKNCASDAYDNSDCLKITDTVLLGITILAAIIAIIVKATSIARDAAKSRRIRKEQERKAEQRRREFDIYKAYYARMYELKSRYNELTQEFPNLSEMPEFLSSVSKFLDSVGRIKTNDTLDNEYNIQCEKMKRDYIDFWDKTLKKLQSDVETANREKPRFTELTEEETRGLSEFQHMISSLDRLR